MTAVEKEEGEVFSKGPHEETLPLFLGKVVGENGASCRVPLYPPLTS